jgi:hypothetical protein
VLLETPKYFIGDIKLLQGVDVPGDQGTDPVVDKDNTEKDVVEHS